MVHLSSSVGAPGVWFAEPLEYWDWRARSYDSHVWHVCCRWVWRRLLEETLPEGGKALDIGTGTGFVADILAEMGYGYVVAVDISLGMLLRARERLRARLHLVELVAASAERLPLREGAVDAAFARHVLWALEDPVSAIREAWRCVRGVAVFTFSTRNEAVPGAPRTPLRVVRCPGDAYLVAAVAVGGGRVEVRDASWVRLLQSVETGAVPRGETGYYVLLVGGR